MMTEVIHIDKKKAKALLKAAVEKRGPETVVSSCSYTEYDKDSQELQPSCMVGEALFIAGVPITNLDNLDGLLCISRYFGDGEGFTLTPGARDVLDRAQSVQDARKPWGDALDEALAV
jgi:hypothetical protein